MLPNGPEFFWVIWGLGKLGAVAVPVNTAAKGELLRYFLDQSESAWVVVEEDWADRVAAVADQLPKVKGYLYLGPKSPSDSVLGHARVSVTDLHQMESGSPEPQPLGAVRYGDLHLIMYTSGTTGPSKGVMSPHSQGHGVGYSLAKYYGYRPDDILYTCLPLFHGNALWYTCYAALWADAAVALAPRFSASQFWDDIKRFGATQFNTLGAMTNIIWKIPPSPQDEDHRLRLCMTVPVPKEIYQELQGRYHLTITSLYAMTETFAVTLFTPDDPPGKAGSAGKTRGYAEIQIVDGEDRRLPSGQTGEICVRPLEPGLMMNGYYKMPEATVKEMRNLWFHSGDRGYVDEDGYLFFVDRSKEAIRRRGENISAYEVELILSKHPSVLEVAAIAVASELSEDDVMTYVVLKPGEKVSPEEIIQFCTDNMAYFMVPRFVEFIDALRKTPSEKIEKYKLKKLADERRSLLWDREKVGMKLKR
ncbi:MAG: AMP-binding protein [Candidatus Eremiobacteraeota bacterium]|nr:AMP-binding protein [Candidatus Eremiobacteraeota bacterium]